DARPIARLDARAHRRSVRSLDRQCGQPPAPQDRRGPEEPATDQNRLGRRLRLHGRSGRGVSARLRIPLWAEIAAAILIALAISNLATIVFFQIEGQRRWQHFGDEILADRIGDAANAILAAPATKRGELIKALSRTRERFSIDAAPLVEDHM